MVIELTVRSFSAELHQEIVVAEDSDFRVVTQAEQGHWYVEGRVGRITDGTARVDLRYGLCATRRYIAATWMEIPIDEYAPSNGGVLMGDWLGGLWLRRGLDPLPVLARSIAKRSKHFNGAVYHLGEMGRAAKPAAPELIGVLDDAGLDRGIRPSESIRGAAARSLGKIGRDASGAVESLLKATRDDNAYVRLEAALALWKIAAHSEAVQVAINAVNDGDHFVRSEAARKLREIGDGGAAPVAALITALADADADVRIAAAQALWTIRRDPAALACLRDVSEDDRDAEARKRALTLMRGIEQEEAAKEQREGSP
ncbi:MAG TPA: HEAT repeat domain-containing protein [Pirellulales bacterium]|nr:HEAT repeat domain-containing protein [Pirellulales bacterium]